jgi:hypothetical protein
MTDAKAKFYEYRNNDSSKNRAKRNFVSAATLLLVRGIIGSKIKH